MPRDGFHGVDSADKARRVRRRRVLRPSSYRAIADLREPRSRIRCGCGRGRGLPCARRAYRELRGRGARLQRRSARDLRAGSLWGKGRVCRDRWISSLCWQWPRLIKCSQRLEFRVIPDDNQTRGEGGRLSAVVSEVSKSRPPPQRHGPVAGDPGPGHPQFWC
jgi:hypothetical protein